MKAIQQALGRRWRFLVLFAWFWAITGLLPNAYRALLSPVFGYVLALGVICLLFYLLVEATESRERRFGMGETVCCVVLLMPLAYLANARGVSLDAYAFRKQSVGSPAVQGERTPEASEDGVADPENPAVRPTDASSAGPVLEDAPTDRATPLEVTILDICFSPRLYEGKRVEFIGMLHKKDDRVIEDLGRDLPLVFRFVINCCVACATPVAVVVDAAGPTPLEENSWVEVTGTFTVVKRKGLRIPLITEATMRSVAAPGETERYLY
jgi:uncharacterized repeat protein (TIGR03943 family)